MLSQIEPQAPLLVVPAQTSSKTGDSIDCRRTGHLTPLRVQAMEPAKKKKSQFWDGAPTRAKHDVVMPAVAIGDDTDSSLWSSAYR